MKYIPTVDELIPYVQQSWDDAQQFMRKQREKLGSRFNHRNYYEQTKERFGACTCEDDCLRYIEEYILISQKKSKLSANIRLVVKDVVDRAVDRYMADRILKEKEKSERHDEENSVAGSGTDAADGL